MGEYYWWHKTVLVLLLQSRDQRIRDANRRKTARDYERDGKCLDEGW